MVQQGHTQAAPEGGHTRGCAGNVWLVQLKDAANNLCTLQEAVYANAALYTAQPEFA